MNAIRKRFSPRTIVLVLAVGMIAVCNAGAQGLPRGTVR